MKISKIKINILICLLSVILFNGTVFGDSFLDTHKGNLDLVPIEDMSKVVEDYIDDDGFGYFIGDTKAYIYSTVENEGRAGVVVISFENDCKYEVWLNDTKYDYSEDIMDENTLFLMNEGQYTIFISVSNDSDFFDQYAVYKCRIGKDQLDEDDPDEVKTYEHNELELVYDDKSNSYIYQLGDTKIITTNKPFDITNNDEFIYKISTQSNVILENIYKDNLTYSLESYSKISEKGKYIFLIDVNSGKNLEKYILKFDIFDALYTNDNFIKIPIGMDIQSLKYNKNNTKIELYNENTLKLFDDGEYDVVYKVRGQNKTYTQKVIKDTNSKLFMLDQDVSSKTTNKLVNIIKLKEDVKLEIMHNGNEYYSENNSLKSNGIYNIHAIDKYGNEQECYFRVYNQFNGIFPIAFVFLIIVAVVLVRKVRS